MNSTATAKSRPVPGEDKRMIDEPRWWPAWPLLPIKRPSADPHAMSQCAVIVDKRSASNDGPWEGEIKVYMTTLGGVPINDDTETLTYSSVGALLLDEWIVD